MELSEINIYPVKSLGGISLAEATIEERGLEFDRRWMLVDEKGMFFTQREYPVMATLKTAIEKDFLRISDKENSSLEIPLAANSDAKMRVRVWSSKVPANLYADQINDWFSERIGVRCRLAVMPEDARRKVNYYYAVHKSQDIVSFADAYPFLLIGENSLGELNARLAHPVPMNRFRPNLVVKDSEGFAEDDWKKIKIGAEIFHLVKPCARCVMTTVDQQTGVPQGKEPLKTLSTFRLVKRGGKAKVNFGQNLIAENFGGKVRLGDKVEILETRKK